MFHSRCDALIQILRLQLSDLQKLLESERAENRAREWELTRLLANTPRPAPTPAPHPPARQEEESDLKVSADLPQELFDAENALYIGGDVVREDWVPRHFTDPKTEAGKRLRGKMTTPEPKVETPVS